MASLLGAGSFDSSAARGPDRLRRGRPNVTQEAGDRTLTVYSGRSESLARPLLEQFGESGGVSIRVKYADSASTAATLLEEGDNTPADVVFLQAPGSLGSLAASGMLANLPPATLDKVDSRLRDPNGRWVGTSGRARTIIYNTESINPDSDLPPTILDFTKEEWRGRVGWAPRNGSFQAFVTALRLQLGEDTARQWRDMAAGSKQEGGELGVLCQVGAPAVVSSRAGDALKPRMRIGCGLPVAHILAYTRIYKSQYIIFQLQLR